MRRRSRVFVALFLVLDIILVYFLAFGTVDESLSDDPDSSVSELPSFDAVMRSATQFIPPATVAAWGSAQRLVVLGIPSMDHTVNQVRRNLQRHSWMRFPGVATRENGFAGDMIVLFVMARHFARGDAYTPELLAEAGLTHDIVALPLNDKRPSTRKTIGTDGFWGLEAEVGVSRKSLLWYSLALQLFPGVPYIAKADDDVFIRVPQYLVDLRRLPRVGVYWGLMLTFSAGDSAPNTRFYYAAGMCLTLARDVAHHIVSFEPLRKLLATPLSGTDARVAKSLNADHEDVMVGRVLYETRNPDIVFVEETIGRFHDMRASGNVGPVTSQSLVVHHLREDEYATLARRFDNSDDVDNTTLIIMPPPTTRVGASRMVCFS